MHKWLCILNIVVYIAFSDKVSLRYKFTCYKISTCTILNAQFSSFKYIHKLHNHHHYLILEHFPHPQNETSYLLAVIHSSLPPASPWQPLIYTLFLCICLIWIFNINRIIWHVIFCDWHLSLNRMFSGLKHIVACPYFIPCFIVVKYTQHKIYHFSHF